MTDFSDNKDLKKSNYSDIKTIEVKNDETFKEISQYISKGYNVILSYKKSEFITLVMLGLKRKKIKVNLEKKVIKDDLIKKYKRKLLAQDVLHLIKESYINKKIIKNYLSDYIDNKEYMYTPSISFYDDEIYRFLCDCGYKKNITYDYCLGEQTTYVFFFDQ